MKTKITFAVISLSILLLGLKPFSGQSEEKGMVKVTLLYQNGEGKTFDMEYYEKKHMPLVAELLGSAMKYYKIDKGIGGRTPNEPVPFLGIGYLYFNKLSDYQEAFGPHAQQIIGDIPNFTNIQPILQISEVVE
ncbi:EthD family reductase [Roseivirga sp.]|uniref:EthD family reductase n=1 Tax=Roseivirga sp. TaxID=1964215 RepID=UPI003B8CBAEA